MNSLRTVKVLGTGSWGTALAIHLAQSNHNVSLWGRDAKAVNEMNTQRCNQRYLPGIKFPESLNVTNELHADLSDIDILVFAIPTHATEAIFNAIVNEMATDKNNIPSIVLTGKGLHPGTGMCLSEFISASSPDALWGVLSGPSFAVELAAGLPTAVAMAANQKQLAEQLAEVFHDGNLRIYTSTDPIGVQMGGAIKNIIAIAAGISDGLGYGANARAALVTRGLAELSRLSEAKGGQRETFMGLAGMGDLLLTCTDDKSRNRRYGLSIGQGSTLEQAQKQVGQVIEGRRNTHEVLELAHKLNVDMPIATEVANVLTGTSAPKEAVSSLLNRAMRSEY